MRVYKNFLFLSLLLPLGGWADNDGVRDALQEYLEFAEYAEGAISVEQMLDVGLASFTIVDTRLEHQYDEQHLPGAVNIEWREIVTRDREIPRDRPVVLYCDTGLLSSKAHLALRLLGHENVKVLFGGFNEWKMHQGIRGNGRH
jgi:rhodanese-related sulfurtransferase